ncbi:MAG: dipeptide epimerase, partial [Planctomycetota bacterium]|nr:dipeptide epimerase [Planctomycetota bacterium]
MNIVSLELFHVAMPLKSTIKHASHARESSDNLVARVTLANGVAGYGEGVPRAYVTGETITSTFETLSKIDLARSFGAPRDFEDVVRGLESLVIAETLDDPRGMRGNAARCALELAVLDAYGRHFGKSIADAVRLVDVEGVARNAAPTGVRYSGAITADDPRRERISAWKMRLYGFHQVKVKVGVEGQDDAARLAKFRRILGNKVDLRLD